LAAGTPCEVSGSMVPRFLSLLLGLAAAATPFTTRAASGADASPSAPYPPKLFVEAQLGLGTPGGAAGGALELQAGPLGLSVDAGEGFSGPQVAGMFRYRFWLKPDFNINIGAGMSAGRYEWVEFSFYDTAEHKLWDVAYWGNAEAGVEMGSRFPRAGVRRARLDSESRRRCLRRHHASRLSEVPRQRRARGPIHRGGVRVRPHSVNGRARRVLASRVLASNGRCALLLDRRHRRRIGRTSGGARRAGGTTPERRGRCAMTGGASTLRTPTRTEDEGQ